MKYILIVLIVSGSSLIGKIISDKYKSRVKFYEIIIKFANFLNLNIYNLHEGIIGIIDKFCSEHEGIIKYDFLKIKEFIIDGNFNKDDVKGLKLCRELKNFEIDEVYDFFNLLGKNNLDSQISLIEKYLHVFNNHLDEARVELKQKGSISFKLSICAGVMLTILLI